MNKDELLDYEKRLNRVIERYEKESIAPQVKDNGKLFWAQVGFYVLLIIFGIITNLAPNLTTLIGSLGLGSLGIGANWERLQEVGKKFMDERNRLKQQVVDLKNELDLADLNEDKLKGVETLLRALRSQGEAEEGAGAGT
jgi:hypothetical protein